MMMAAKTMDAYLRVSRVGERAGAESYGSPEDQREAIRRWAEYKGVEIVREHLDEDESGGSQERPGLEAAIARALAGETDGIVAYDISRFSRFTEGGLRDLRRLQEAGARLVFATEEIDTSTPHGRLIYTILLATHEAALEQHKARWRVTKARGIREGRQIGPTPVGYTRARENGKHGQLVPHPTEGPAIMRAFELAATQGLRAAVAHLQTTIPTKTFVARKRKTAERYGVKLGDSVTVEATWNPATVRRLLKQRVYLGAAYYGDELYNADAHEPLVDLDTWTLAQSEPDDRRARPADFPLTAFVRCASCGGNMAGSRSGSKAAGNYRRMYKCTNRACARRVSVSAVPLEQLGRELLATHAGTDSMRDPGPSPEALEPVRAALQAAETRLREWRADKEQREQLGDAAHAAVAETYEGNVAAAQRAYEAMLQGAITWPLSAADIIDAQGAELGDAFDAYGRVLRVLPGRGKLGERVTLEPAGA
ncbi:MAG: site-specific recombinase [Thermoleophilaceae bacterium]|nr:site-specific recombinase [Thermoleophilaceae bacterium]